MDGVIVSMFVLMLYVNGDIKEYMGHHENSRGEWVEMGMTGCLAMKRTLKRNGWRNSATGRTRYVCEKRSALIKKNHKGLPVVVGILSGGFLK